MKPTQAQVEVLKEQVNRSLHTLEAIRQRAEEAARYYGEQADKEIATIEALQAVIDDADGETDVE